jgi:hypothetical protein
VGVVLTTRRDSFPRQATEIFILQMMLKNFLFYGFSTFINTWTATDGAGTVFRTWGITSLCMLATCIPMCKFIFPHVVKRMGVDVQILMPCQTCLGRSTGGS